MNAVALAVVARLVRGEGTLDKGPGRGDVTLGRGRPDLVRRLRALLAAAVAGLVVPAVVLGREEVLVLLALLAAKALPSQREIYETVSLDGRERPTGSQRGGTHQGVLGALRAKLLEHLLLDRRLVRPEESPRVMLVGRIGKGALGKRLELLEERLHVLLCAVGVSAGDGQKSHKWTERRTSYHSSSASTPNRNTREGVSKSPLAERPPMETRTDRWRRWQSAGQARSRARSCSPRGRPPAQRRARTRVRWPRGLLREDTRSVSFLSSRLCVYQGGG